MKIYKLVVSLIACFSAAALGSAFTNSQITSWYATLNKPFFNPPNWIFGPVWTLLYILMAISLAMVWSTKNKKKNEGITYFILQLVLNSLWSIVFFGLHFPLGALIVIIGLWTSIYITIKKFWAISPMAAKLMVPYICWVSFASILNLAVVVLN